MNSEHTQILLEEFPELYWQYNLDMKQTAMCWGFDVGDGWFDLIYKLSQDLKPLAIKYNKEYGPEYKFAVVQVKEKFGTLRYYINAGTDEIHDLIFEAENKSEIICEICGQPGMINKGPWYMVRCKEHWPKGE